MLTSLVLKLQSPEAVTLPSNLGRASQALFFRLMAGYDAALAEALHESSQVKPFTVSNLIMGKRQRGEVHVAAQEVGWLRFTGLVAEVSQVLQAICHEPPVTVELDGFRLRVTGATLDGQAHRWAGQVSYQELAVPYLLGEKRRLSSSMSLEFVSPTTFRSKGVFVPFPMSSLVFGSLLDRWQAHAPIALHPEVRRYAEELVGVNFFEGRSQMLPHKDGGQVVGFTGEARFQALNRDGYWLSVLHLLADFAFYSGVGYQTTIGLGQVRKQVSESVSQRSASQSLADG